jgi:hypothetical protein
MGIPDKYLLAVIPGGNILRIRHVLLITQKIPSGNDSERRLARISIYLVYNVLGYEVLGYEKAPVLQQGLVM